MEKHRQVAEALRLAAEELRQFAEEQRQVLAAQRAEQALLLAEIRTGLSEMWELARKLADTLPVGNRADTPPE